MNLTEIEKEYRKSLENEVDLLQDLYLHIKSNYLIPKNGNEISKVILLRMKSYYDGKNKIKELLNKRYLLAGSDFFVETVVFYLKLYCEMYSTKLEIHSERQIRKKRGAIRPDISVWKNDEVTCIIECKTQLGWNRYNWEDDFRKRETKLKSEFPNAQAFLLVMTSENWSGFPENEDEKLNQFFTLSSVWPPNIVINNINDIIINPIETLFKKIISI
ncbi:MAG: hypothetical protein A2V93_07160 [Ignavibacteria bacterium RBG_16_34_14]|nr:MAG: hypothetical protein A2V93_07160 [Ignavibacteria bacterium RBG_16_34_14]